MKKYIILLLIVLTTSMAFGQVSIEERQALHDLFNATGGPQWYSQSETNPFKWDFSIPVTSNWHGITVIDNKVVKIRLDVNNLIGPIPSSIGNLLNLTELNLGVNKLEGPIPKEISSLQNLVYLGLYGNQLSGEIPDEIGNLAALKNLSLAGNNLTGEIPNTLAYLDSLTDLQLFSNQLSGEIPDEIVSLVNLEVLNLSSNRLSGEIPESIDNIGDLRILNLDFNEISGQVPESITMLSKLTSLGLGANRLTGIIPRSIGNLDSLKTLHLNENQIIGTIPKELGQLKNLTTLRLSDNQLIGGIPPDLGSLKLLRNLFLNNNQLSGKIPYELKQLDQLSFLWLDSNKFQFGDFEEDIDFYDGIPYFRLAPQSFTDDSYTIPSGLGQSLTLRTTVSGTQNRYQWYKDDSPITGALSSQLTIPNAQISDSGVYHCEVTSDIVTGLTLVRNDITLTVSQGDCTYDVWYEDADIDGLGDPNGPIEVGCQPPTTGGPWVDNGDDQCINVQSDTNDCYNNPTTNCSPSTTGNAVQLTGNNYNYTRTYQSELTSAPDFFTENPELIQEVTYFDGLGRPIQNIGIDQAPEGEDIITHMEYDRFGRREKDFLPYSTSNGVPGNYRPDARNSTISFYVKPKYQGTTNPYSRKDFEPSPLNRVLKQAAPGEDWKLGNGHEIELDYLTNTTSEVRLFAVDLSAGNENPVLNEDGFYTTGELYKNVTKDENHETGDGKLHTTEEFTDKQGRVVLKRTYANIGAPAMATAHDTYYIYDDFGNLTYVLPPKMEGSTATLSEINTNMAALGYQYVYDHRNRLVEKQVPGKEKEYIVYNKLDQPVLTQDANQRLNNEWLFTKYDAFGRVAYTGKTTDSQDRPTIQNIVSGLTAQLWVEQLTTDQNPEFTENIEIYYGNGAYPTNIDEVLTINYYDTYVDRPASAPLSITLLDSPSGENQVDNVRGLATISKVKVLNQSPAKWIHTMTYYDDKGRPVFTFSANEFLGTTDIVETKLDFIGKPLKSKTTHIRGTNTIVTIDNFQYDHVGRLLAQTQCIGDENMGDSCPNGVIDNTPLQLTGTIDTDRTNGNSIIVGPVANILPGQDGSTTLSINSGSEQELIVFNDYDELGQLANKKVGGAPESDYTSTQGLQEVNYKYNVRGWLTTINDISDATPDKLFNFKIGYTDGDEPLYNGNISNTQWRTDNLDKNLRTYQYSYDAMNRITSAIDNTGNYDLETVTYDKNGNITKLGRDGHLNTAGTSFGRMDNLLYAYDGNQLKALNDQDNFSSDTGFFDGAELTTEYTYDPNGNMITDANKGITGITYNHLNLPTNVIISSASDDGTMDYTYDALGSKLQKRFYNATNGTTVTNYSGNYIYENDVLQFIKTPEGYVMPNTTGGYYYVYQYKDHLGNIRLSYMEDPSNSDVTMIVDEDNYYPFGGLHRGYNNVTSAFGNSVAQKWKFGGKELDRSLDLNTYDFGARNYDPWVGRWMNVDPLAEQMRRHSPYNYAFDNPISFIDPDGMAPFWINNGDGTWTAEAGDSAASLSEDAGISLDQANKVVESQLGENYIGEDGELKSDVEVGDVVEFDVIEGDHTIVVVPDDTDIAENSGTQEQYGDIAKDRESVAKLALVLAYADLVTPSPVDVVLRGLGGDITTKSSRSSSTRTTSKSPSTTKLPSGHTRTGQTVKVSGQQRAIIVGPQGGKYYINSNGNRVPLNRDGTKRN